MSGIWVCDFEFFDMDGGEIPRPICFCALEVTTREIIQLWLEGINKPVSPIDFSDKTLTYIAFNSVAEMSCHLALGWDIPENILDLYCEWRLLSNDGRIHEKGHNSLLNVCGVYGVKTVDLGYKTAMRDRILKGAPFNEAEKIDILNYCMTDVWGTADLYKAMCPSIDKDRAFFRGRYMAITAQMVHEGVPLDADTFTLIRNNWEHIKMKLIQEIDKEFNFFDGLTFKTDRFAEYLQKNNIAWEYTELGHLRMDEETWDELSSIHIQLRPVHEIRKLLSKFKTLNITCGPDGNNRGSLFPFSTKTGRNAPNKECIFTNPSWLRCLIKPKAGTALAYLDFEQQEFYIAGILSQDIGMRTAYKTGDPYLKFGQMAGAIPLDGTKKTHKAVRDIYKRACLGIQYGMGAQRLAIYIGKPPAYAEEILRQHKRLFPGYWKWRQNVILQAKLNRRIRTMYGWEMKVLQGSTKEDLTLGNYLMQATGADILRIACHLLTEAGIRIVAPVHDALMIQVSLDTADADIKKAEGIMQEASRIVLGQPLRTEAMVIKYPHRYTDEKGEKIFNKVLEILYTDICKTNVKLPSHSVTVP